MRVLSLIVATAALLTVAGCEKAEDRRAAASEPKFDVRYCLSEGGDSTIRMPVDGCLVSPNKQFILRMTDAGALEVSHLAASGPVGAPVWTAGSKAARRHVASAVFQEDGNLVIYEGLNALWNAGVVGPKGSAYHLALTDDGNLVIRNAPGQALWSARFNVKLCAEAIDAPAQMTSRSCLASPARRFIMALDPSGALTVSPISADSAPGKPVWTSGSRGAAANSTFLALQGDGNLVIYEGAKPIWNSQTNGPPGAYRLDLTDQGALVLHAPDGKALWSSTSGKT